ncbi:hypothetical protein Q765_05105 [Flavobacterium rivuli WB 3.3-2 = DSM 21788]|uniref:Uncharacterized protein n=2 Tax=Flavobacterium rivuli TaxID=498301 RepID=A0A0A2M6F1_9FLAO|nr:hypothetical protein Q765_05105 [Flavobacterium rivuli WB 3.3-2 = DSM 21788]
MCSCTVRKPHENTSVAENYAKESRLYSIYPQLSPPYPQDTLNMYVIAHNGTKAYTKDLKERGRCFPFMQELRVITVSDSLVSVINNTDNNSYVKRKTLGYELNIVLTKTELNKPYSHIDNTTDSLLTTSDCGKTGGIDEPFNPDDYPDMEVDTITKLEFLKLEKSAVSDFKINNAVKKVNGTITIAGVEFKDNKGEGDLPNTYDYLGEYKAMQAYVILLTCEACEQYYYMVISKKTGQELYTSVDFPYFSKDGKTVISVGQLFSDQPTIVNYSRWSDNSWQLYADKEFSTWSPVGNGFWGKDNYFYTAAIPSATREHYNNSSELRNRNGFNFRYLKIKIKGKTRKFRDE